MYIAFKILFFFFLPVHICFTQSVERTDNSAQEDSFIFRPSLVPHTPLISAYSLHPSFYDRKSEWPIIIKEFWGPGGSTSEKLSVFDTYQNYARANNPTFLWNPVNWDSLAVNLRQKINDSTSRGEFARILKDLSSGMKDGHSSAYDNIILNTPLNPGTPILADGGIYITNFGAGLTVVNDSSLLVYKVSPNHPLGLEPGDIILGYQGVPWSHIVQELLDGGVPHNLWLGASASARNHNILWSAGESWHLFDTIDIKKYSTGQILHLPLDSMVTLIAPSNMVNNEQLPVPGVPMPEFNWNSGAVTYGMVQGTNIGYIYVFHNNYPEVSQEFDSAVLALMNTDGLIIDIRFEIGGNYNLNNGISRLLNHPTSTIDPRVRCSSNDLYTICSVTTPSPWIIPSDAGTYYDRPVAVLLGPDCFSLGDFISWQLSYVPNARMFGKSPQAIFSGTLPPQPAYSGYSLRCTNRTLVDHYNPDVPRWGQEYPLFEEAWLTPEGVANGIDNVVERALEWINNLSYAHNIISDKTFYPLGSDSVSVTANIENPNSHQLSVRGYIRTLEGELKDSADFVPGGFALDSEQWSAKFNLPVDKGFFDISVNVQDITTGTQFATPNAARFTTVGPVILDSLSFTKVTVPPNTYAVRLFIKNLSDTTLVNLTGDLLSDDPWIDSILSGCSFPDIVPGGTAASTDDVLIKYNSGISPNEVSFTIRIFSDDWKYWEDSIEARPLTNEEDLYTLEYYLGQNYPNPFNPVTKFRYSVPVLSRISLIIYDMLGREIETIVNEEKPAGTHELTWYAEQLPSGIYFYRIQAGSFVQTKKMILMK